MSIRRKFRSLLALVALSLGILLGLLVIPIDPSYLAALAKFQTSYGYTTTPLPTSPGVLPACSNASFHGIRQASNPGVPSATSAILYHDGVVSLEADGVSVPAPGFSFSHRPTYNNNHEFGSDSIGTDGNLSLSQGWNWHSGLFGLADMGSGRIRLMGKGTASSDFYGTSPSYAGEFGVDASLAHDSTNRTMTLRATNGASAKFYDFNALNGNRVGALQEIVHPNGTSAILGYNTTGTFVDMVDAVTDTAGNVWKYNYIDNAGHGDHKKLGSVELRRDAVLLGKSEYKYYDSQSTDFAAGSGTDGDLMRIIVTEKDSNGDEIQRTTLFRYYTGSWSSQNLGAAHKLKYVVSPQEYKDLDDAVLDPLKATSTEVATYADRHFEYDSSCRVTKAVVEGSGCSCGGGSGAITYSYESNGSWTQSSGFGVWRLRVTQTNPDGTVRMLDLNKAGAIINEVVQTDSSYDAQTDQRWITHYEFDTSGRVTAIYHPSACSAYDNSTHAVTSRTNSGLIDLFTFDSSGNLTERKAKQGSSGTAYWLEKRSYGTKQLGSQTMSTLSSVTVYPTATTTDMGGVATSIAYSWHPDSSDLDGDSNTTEDALLIKEKTLTLPAVSESENGENVQDVHKYYYNALGQLAWEKDPEGAITYRGYHADLGLLAREVVDTDTDGFSPTPPTGYTNSTGVHIETLHSYRGDGKLEETTDPTGRVEKRFYTHLSGGESVVLTYPHVGLSAVTGPASISVFDLDGRVVTTAKGAPTDGDAVLSDDFDDTQATLESAFAGDLFARTESVYEGGQKVEDRQWTNAESGAAEKYVTEYGYDDMGRLARVKDAEGTITRTYYTVTGSVGAQEVGTNDYGDDLGEPSGTNNMTVVRESYYDDEEDASTNVGDGNLTRVRSFVGASSSRDVDYAYDWRNRRITADGEEDFFEKTDYDNLNRPTISYRYAGSESAANLRQKSETKYDARGQVWQRISYEVSPTVGTIDDSLTTNYWYNGRGDLIKERSPSGAFRKSAYDGARRVTKTFLSYDTDETAYGDADDVDGDTVIEQAQEDRDDAGSVLLQTRFERRSTATATGELTTTSGVRYYTAFWYDEIHRLTDTANYGTNGGTTLSRPSTAPASSDTVLVTSHAYNSAGLIEETTDPAGRDARQEYDNLGRLSLSYSNYIDGTPGSAADDRKLELTYDKLSQVTKRKTWMSSSEAQETEYVYGVTKGTRPDSEIASKRLLKTIKYADPSTGAPSTSADDQESFAYSAQGEIVYRKDQNGSIHEFDFDEVGRRTADKVTTLGTGVDGSIRRIQASYDALGRPLSVTSYDAATSGTVKNEVELTYNGFGQVTQSWQEHDGAVDAYSLLASYSYSEAENSDPLSRLTHIQYPATNRRVYVYYDDPAGATDHAKMDWVMGRPSTISNSSLSTGDRLGDYVYQGTSRVVTRAANDPTDDLWIEYYYDRLGRIEYLWPSSGSTYFNEFRYGYDRNSSVLWREENSSTGKDELYTYDALDRLDVFKRGDLNSGRTDITSPTRSQDWGLDLLGNWGSIATSGTSVNRTHNRSNEITDVDQGYTGGDPTFDKNGNTTLVQRGNPNNFGRIFVYDAWNRVVQVDSASPSFTLAKYFYDGLGRKIRDDQNDRDYYYSESWQLLSERNGPTTSDKTLREYVWGLQYVDEILARDEDKNSDGDTRDAADETLFYVQDANWNVQTLCSESGAVAERYRYDPYGTPTVYDASWTERTGGSLYDNSVLFTGRWWNPTIYTYEYRHREYSPSLGRFLQRDPIGIWGDGGNAGNGYAYAGCDPINETDPRGEKTREEVWRENLRRTVAHFNETWRLAAMYLYADTDCDGVPVWVTQLSWSLFSLSSAQDNAKNEAIDGMRGDMSGAELPC